MQSVYLQRIMKKNADKGFEKQSQNKPNSNPKQTQSKPVLSAVEWANFFKVQNELKIACRKIWPYFNKPKKNLDNPETND